MMLRHASGQKRLLDGSTTPLGYFIKVTAGQHLTHATYVAQWGGLAAVLCCLCCSTMALAPRSNSTTMLSGPVCRTLAWNGMVFQLWERRTFGKEREIWRILGYREDATWKLLTQDSCSKTCGNVFGKVLGRGIPRIAYGKVL